MRNYFYSARKAGRPGRFCDVMIMSGGRGLAQHGRGWKNVWNVGSFKLGTQFNFAPRANIYLYTKHWAISSLSS